jgi:hypothetical protein
MSIICPQLGDKQALPVMRIGRIPNRLTIEPFNLANFYWLVKLSVIGMVNLGLIPLWDGNRNARTRPLEILLSSNKDPSSSLKT